MYVNEVISFKANELAKKSLVHPNDDVNIHNHLMMFSLEEYINNCYFNKR